VVTADHECGGLKVVKNRGLGQMPEVKWSSGGHTTAAVPVFAWGVGAERFKGKIDNTDIAPRILELPETDKNVDQEIFMNLTTGY